MEATEKSWKEKILIMRSLKETKEKGGKKN
jgi:hypothetical protein